MTVEASRRQARERALELLYEAEAKECTVDELLAELPLEPDAFAIDLVAGVDEHRAALDDVISRFTRDWPVERMPAVDRALLRIGVFELIHRPEIPVGAVISEAVELAKRYSTEHSGRFVNGMLARIAEDVRPEEEPVIPSG